MSAARAIDEPPAEAVLIAEDDEINRVVASAMLTSAGRRTVLARDGAEAVRMAMERRFAAILMDCEMPGVDGFEAARMIRAAESGEHVPIIAMTAHDGPEGKERCLAAGMDDFLLKPLDPARLDAVVGAWIGHVKVINEAPERPRSDELVDMATIAQLRDVLAGGMPTDLLSAFDAALARSIASVAGAQARGDSAEVRRVARLLKGSATTLGAARLRACCAELERDAAAGKPLDAARIAELRAVGERSLAALRTSLAPVADEFAAPFGRGILGAQIVEAEQTIVAASLVGDADDFDVWSRRCRKWASEVADALIDLHGQEGAAVFARATGDASRGGSWQEVLEREVERVERAVAMLRSLSRASTTAGIARPPAHEPAAPARTR